MTTFMCMTCLRPHWPFVPTCCPEPMGSYVSWHADYPRLNRLLAETDLASQGLS